MLQSLHVKNLALIDELEIEFQKGLNILTGETGAGKSIIIGSINLALGERYQTDILRKNAETGFVELVFYVQNQIQIQLLNQLEIFPEDGTVILARRFVENRSYSKINGETVTARKLKQAAEVLIDIYGQREHQSLLDPVRRLGILDEFGKHKIEEVKEEVKKAYAQYRSCRTQLDENLLDEKSRQKEVSLIQFEINEIREAQIKENEDEQLEELYKRMAHGKKIMESLMEAYTMTGDEQGQNAATLLSRALGALKDAAMYDVKMEELHKQLGEIEILISDFNHDLMNYEKTMEFSEKEFAEVEMRLNTINHLKSKYGYSIDEILKYLEVQEKRLQELIDYDAYIERLRKAYAKAAQQCENKMRILHELRVKYAKQLSEQIQAGLLELNFLQVQFEILVSKKDIPTEQGQDVVDFLVSLNPGEELKLLENVVSGGEMSRIMLAVKSVLADADDTETLIFDEIDVGISGRTAQKISEKLALLSGRHQVLCITHLAQIAAMADAHYLIEKSVTGNETKTTIKLLDGTQEMKELARILGGVEITDTVMNNAKEMKQLAKSQKKR